ncbi:MAG: NAD(P)-dependent oxidoreductase [Elusimicrobia bacterium]|nr:NAD(P)-dependent oxidoreductase [Elusimicrobiota bacterium]
MNKRAKILLTGGGGFIGKNLLESPLARKYEIAAPRHAELDLLDEDAVRNYIKSGNFDFVIHSASKPGHRNAKEPGKVFYENTRMFFNLARSSEYFKKMLVTGSGAIYDMRHYRPKMKEDYFDGHVPVDEHGFCKYVCGKYIEGTDNITDLRVFGIYGKYEDYAIRFISNMICKAVCGLPLTIKQNRRFDYIWVDDLLSVMEYFLENNACHKAYNVTPDKSVELLELADKVLRISGKDLPIKVAQLGLGQEYSGDNSRLRAEIKGLSFTPPDEAIGKLYSWYNANKDSINRETLLSDK